ncbi:MAG: OmpH family outer membrane protein [Candidatus Puniceispirillaceae bacterium]
MRLAHFIIACLLWVGSAMSPAMAQTADESVFATQRVALIDLAYVLRNASATTTIRDLLDAKKAEFSAEFQEREAKLLQRERELNLKRSVLSETDFNAEVQAFQEDVSTIQREIQFKRNSLDQAFQQAQDNLREIAVEIVTSIAQREQLDLVMTKETALIFRPGLNITDEVLEMLNERTKNARIEVGELPF